MSGAEAVGDGDYGVQGVHGRENCIGGVLVVHQYSRLGRTMGVFLQLLY